MSKFLGWEVEFKDETNDKTYTGEITEVNIGLDSSSSIVMCSLKFIVDSSFNKYFLKQHEGTLTISNKLMRSDIEEMFKIKLQSISNTGNVLTRSPEDSQSNTVIIPVKYMCKEGVTLLNARVGNVYYKKKLEDIINDLYSQSKCNLPLKLEKLNNQDIIENIEVPESSFVEAIRYLNQQYGLYDNLFLMFGDTFSDESFNWIISNANKLNREEVTLKFLQYDFPTQEKETKSIDERTYYTHIPVNIQNNFTSVIKKVPQLIKYVSFDNERFMKRMDIPFAKKLKELNFVKANDQFDQLMELPTKLIQGTNFNLKDYTIKDIIQKVGLSSFSIPRITIPNPFKLAHFKIGTPINFISNNEAFLDSDVKLIVVGWLLNLKQGNGSGGAMWNSKLTVRTVTTSYKDSNN